MISRKLVQPDLQSHGANARGHRPFGTVTVGCLALDSGADGDITDLDIVWLFDGKGNGAGDSFRRYGELGQLTAHRTADLLGRVQVGVKRAWVGFQRGEQRRVTDGHLGGLCSWRRPAGPS